MAVTLAGSAYLTRVRPKGRAIFGGLMGLYDNRCMVTGVSLRGSDAALVLLQQTGAAYRPIAPAVKGSYDRGGSVDSIHKRDPNARLLRTFFLAKLKSGELQVEEHALRVTGRWPVNDLERVLWSFERAMNDGQESWLNGRPVVFALICRAVWDAVVRSARPTARSPTAIFRELLGGSPVAREIYQGSLMDVAEHLRELSAVSRFLTRRKIAWTPTLADGSQHSSEEMWQYLEEARRAFAAAPEVLEGLDAYEVEVQKCLEEVFDTDKIDAAVLALLYLGVHDGCRAWKGFDWDALRRLHEAGYICDPRGTAKSVLFTSEGVERARHLLQELFGKRA